VKRPATMRPIEEVRSVPKHERKRLAKAELLIFLAMKADEWAKAVSDADDKTTPFGTWPDNEPFMDLALRYCLSGADLGKILDSLGGDLENRAERCGYSDAWVD
jgi:hypothetical protein